MGVSKQKAKRGEAAPEQPEKSENTLLRLSIRFLGGARVEIGGAEIEPQLPVKCLMLLAYLASSGKAHSRDSLAALLWSDFPEDRARANLRDLLAKLRCTPLASCFRIDRRSVSFEPGPFFSFDVRTFSQNLNLGRGLTADIAALEAAVDLYRGEFLQGFQARKAALFEDWLDEQRRSFQAEVVHALQKLSEYHLNEGNLVPAGRYLRQLLSIEPCMEGAHRSLMLLLFMQGDYEAVIRQYRLCEKILFNELGIKPSKETRRLLKNLRTHVDKDFVRIDQPAEGPAQQASGYVPHYLPNQFTPFIGRNREQRAIETALKDRTARLVTLLGVGGSGKTRLAIAIGGKQARAIKRDGSLRFQDGVYFVALETVENVREIVPAVSRAIDFQPADEALAGRSVEDQLLSYLEEKRMLLILDNFEQLLDGVGLLADILRKTRHVCLLVTSRQKLGLQGERLFSLGGLTYPESLAVTADAGVLEADYDAPRLFLASARRSKPEFELQPEDIPALVRLCRLVDGLPLAIELAAGWTDVLPVGAITAEIESKLTILESRYRDLPARHNSMQAVFDVSWRRLAPAEQEIFRKLCVFRGGFTNQAAEEVIETNYRQLANLVSKSLAQYDDKTRRYRVHPLLRGFGEARLVEHHAAAVDVRNRHSVYYCALLAEWNRWLKTDRQLEALTEFDHESANALAAWNTALDIDDIERLEKATDGIFRLYLWRQRFQEGETISHNAEEHLSAEPTKQSNAEYLSRRQRLLARIKIWRSNLNAPASAELMLQEAFQILEDADLAGMDTRIERAMAFQRAGDLAFSRHPTEARHLYEQSLCLYREAGDDFGGAKVLTQMGWNAVHFGDAEEARRLGEEALALVRPTGDCKRTADILWLLGTLAIMQVDVSESARLFTESIEIRESLGDHITDIMSGPLDLGMTLTWIGRFEEADLVRQEALALYKSNGRAEQIAWAHIRLGTSKLHIGDNDALETHARIGLAQCRKLKDDHGVGIALWLLGGKAMIDGAYDDAEMFYTASVEALGRVSGATEICWVFSLGADIAFRQGKTRLAQERLYDAFTSASGAMGLIAILIGLSSYCRFLLDQNRNERCLEIVTLLSKHPLTASPAFDAIFNVHIDHVRQTISPENIKRVEASGVQRDFYETAKEVVEELVGESKTW